MARIRKALFSIGLALAILFTICSAITSPASALSDAEIAAEELYRLGLFNGTSTNADKRLYF